MAGQQSKLRSASPLHPFDDENRYGAPRDYADHGSDWPTAVVADQHTSDHDAAQRDECQRYGLPVCHGHGAAQRTGSLNVARPGTCGARHVRDCSSVGVSPELRASHTHLPFDLLAHRSIDCSRACRMLRVGARFMSVVHVVLGALMLAVASYAILGRRHMTARANARGAKPAPEMLWIVMGTVLGLAGVLQVLVAFQ
jgi:hypothetical protein